MSMNKKTEFAPGPGAQQQFRDDVDINLIVKRARKTGQLSTGMSMSNRRAQFGDFSDVTDYKTARDQINNSVVAFFELPAHVRRYFHNDPANLLDFVADDKNLKKAIELGLVDKNSPNVIAEIERQKAAEEAAKAAQTATEGGSQE